MIANSHLHRPFSPLALCSVWVPWSLCSGLCAHQDFKAHLVHCAQEKAGGELPDLRPERARNDLAKVKQSHGKAEVRSLSSLMCSGCSPPGSLGVQERIGLSPATWLCRLPWASWGVAGFSSLERMGRRPLQEDFECSVDTGPCSCHPLSEPFRALSLGPSSCSRRVGRPNCWLSLSQVLWLFVS